MYFLHPTQLKMSSKYESTSIFCLFRATYSALISKIIWLQKTFWEKNCGGGGVGGFLVVVVYSWQSLLLQLYAYVSINYYMHVRMYVNLKL